MFPVKLDQLGDEKEQRWRRDLSKCYPACLNLEERQMLWDILHPIGTVVFYGLIACNIVIWTALAIRTVIDKLREL